MVFYLFLLALIVFNGLTICHANCFNNDYLNKNETTAINGIFVILVVFSHYAQYADLGGVYDAPYSAFRSYLNQLVVATFLFYSGYGMMESIKKRGSEYIKTIPVKFWKLLFRFDCAVFVYLVLDCCLGKYYSLKHIMLAFTSWSSIGNSNWYITAILILYVCLFFSFSIGLRIINNERKGEITGCIIMSVLTVAAVYIQMKMNRPDYCYNTMFLFPLGCFFSVIKAEIESFLMNKDTLYLLVLAILIVLYNLSYFSICEHGIEGYTIWACTFILTIIIVTMKVKIYNSILVWFGKHIFSIYILQRIPMMILDQAGLVAEHKYICLSIVFATTPLLALTFEKLTDSLIIKIERNKLCQVRQTHS